MSCDCGASMSFDPCSPIAVRGQMSHGENKQVWALHILTDVQVLEGLISLSFWSLGFAKSQTYTIEWGTGKLIYFDFCQEIRPKLSSNLIQVVSTRCRWMHGIWVGREGERFQQPPSFAWGPAGPANLNGVSARVKGLWTTDDTWTLKSEDPYLTGEVRGPPV